MVRKLLVSSLLLASISFVDGADVKPSKAAGKVAGRPFVPTQAKIRMLGLSHVKVNGEMLDQARQWTLTFQVGDEFLPEQELVLWLHMDPGAKLDGKSIHVKPYKFGTPEFRAQMYGAKKSNSIGRGVTGVMITYPVSGPKKTETESFSDQLSVRLTFGKTVKDKINGEISVILPDKSKSYLKGKFVATHSKW